MQPFKTADLSRMDGRYIKKHRTCLELGFTVVQKLRWKERRPQLRTEMACVARETHPLSITAIPDRPLAKLKGLAVPTKSASQRRVLHNPDTMEEMVDTWSSTTMTTVIRTATAAEKTTMNATKASNKQTTKSTSMILRIRRT